MNIRRTSKGHVAEFSEGDEISIARAVDRLEVLDDPFSVLFAKGCLAAEGVRDRFACRLVGDVSMSC